jgi:hypothetical protein
MALRTLFAFIVASVLLNSTGCCFLRRVFCDDCCSPCETGAFTYFAGRSCGEAYYGDWKSHPPKCDPCDDCGNYVGCSPCDESWPLYRRPLRTLRTFLFGDCCATPCDGCY